MTRRMNAMAKDRKTWYKCHICGQQFELPRYIYLYTDDHIISTVPSNHLIFGISHLEGTGQIDFKQNAAYDICPNCMDQVEAALYSIIRSYAEEMKKEEDNNDA